MGDTESKILKYIVMTQMKSIGPVTQNTLIDICGDIDSCFEISHEDLINADEKHVSKGSRIGRERISSFIRQREDEAIWHKVV